MYEAPKSAGLLLLIAAINCERSTFFCTSKASKLRTLRTVVTRATGLLIAAINCEPSTFFCSSKASNAYLAYCGDKSDGLVDSSDEQVPRDVSALVAERVV